MGSFGRHALQPAPCATLHPRSPDKDHTRPYSTLCSPPPHQPYQGGDPLEDVDEDESSAGHTHLGPCSAVARTGIPARAPLFNATICDAVPHARLARASQGRVEVAQPMALPLPGPDGEYPEPIRQRHMTVYLHSQGEVTALDAEGDLLWKVGRWGGHCRGRGRETEQGLRADIWY